MFLIIDKEKISTYLVSIVTVILLFFAANVFTPKNKSIEASTSIENYVNNTNENSTDE